VYSLGMWWLGMFLEAVLLVRGLRTRLIFRFPLFYSYLLVVLVQDVIRYIARQWYYDVYKNVYWSTQYLCLVMGSLVIFEIYRIALQEFPGTARMARNLLRAALIFIFVTTMLSIGADTSSWMVENVKLERDLRMVQSIGILILVALFLWYGVPLARNLGGILLGYTVFVALSVVQLSIVNRYESKAQPFWAIVQPILYTTALGIWIFRLWSDDAVTLKLQRGNRRGDYQDLLNSTNRSLEEARTRLGSAVRP